MSDEKTWRNCAICGGLLFGKASDTLHSSCAADRIEELEKERETAETQRDEYQKGAFLVAKGSHDMRAMLDECAPYLKDGETPRQRMDRDHADVLSLMEMLAKDRKERDEARAEGDRLAALLREAEEALTEALSEMRDYADTHPAYAMIARARDSIRARLEAREVK